MHSFKSNTRFRTCRDDHQEQVANQMQTHPEAEIAFVYAVESNLDITNFLNFIEDFILDSVANATLSCLQSFPIVPFPTRKLHKYKGKATLVRYPSTGDVSHTSKFPTHFPFIFRCFLDLKAYIHFFVSIFFNSPMYANTERFDNLYGGSEQNYYFS